MLQAVWYIIVILHYTSYSKVSEQVDKKCPLPTSWTTDVGAYDEYIKNIVWQSELPKLTHPE